MPDIHILVIDDFLQWQRFVIELFETETDLKIIAIASDGLEAVRKAKEIQPDLILMDINLPGMNGYEAMREIRIFSPASKILFVSEHRSCDLIEAAFDAGASGYVLKSDAYSDLILGIRTALLDRRFVSRSLKKLAKGLERPGRRHDGRDELTK